eukprot:2524011-Amphidinium_carterae.1
MSTTTIQVLVERVSSSTGHTRKHHAAESTLVAGAQCFELCKWTAPLFLSSKALEQSQQSDNGQRSE